MQAIEYVCDSHYLHKIDFPVKWQRKYRYNGHAIANVHVMQLTTVHTHYVVLYASDVSTKWMVRRIKLCQCSNNKQIIADLVPRTIKRCDDLNKHSPLAGSKWFSLFFLRVVARAAPNYNCEQQPVPIIRLRYFLRFAVII